jgi:hypothetical protein
MRHNPLENKVSSQFRAHLRHDGTWQAGPLMYSAYGGTTDVSLAEGTLGFNSVEVCNHLLLGKGFESIKAEAASFEGRTSVRGNQLGVHFGGNREFYKKRNIVISEWEFTSGDPSSGPIYHVVKSRIEQEDPWRGCCGDGNPVVGY